MNLSPISLVSLSCPTPAGGGSGSGSSGGGNASNFAEDAKARASARLDNTDCFDLIFKGPKWKTPEGAKGELELRSIDFTKDLGAIVIGGTSLTNWGTANATWGGNNGGTIYLNSRVFPNSTTANIDVFGTKKCPLDVFHHTYDVNLTADQFEEVVILHELWHIAGGTKDSVIDTVDSAKELLSKCIK